MQPNFNFNFSASILIFIGAIAFSYFTHNGWWALGGLSYFIYDRIAKYDAISVIFDYILLIATAIFFLVGAFKMGWGF